MSSAAHLPHAARGTSAARMPADPGPGETVRADAEAATTWIELRPTAWLITRESGDLVHASALVYELLDRTPAELARTLADPGDSSPGFSWIRRRAVEQGCAHVVLRLPVRDGTIRELDVVSHRLPPRRGEEDRYYSVLSAREG